MTLSTSSRILLLSLAATPLLRAAETAKPADSNEDNPLVLDQVEVTASREDPSILPISRPTSGILGDTRDLVDTPRAATTLTPAFIQSHGIDSLAEVVKYSPSAYAPSSYGLLTTPVIRGDTAETYVNGQRLGYNNYGYLPSFNSVEAIDVVRGPASAVFGSGYLVGGYVNYQTKQPSFAGPETVVTARVGTWVPGTENSYFNTTVQLDTTAPLSDTLAYRVSIEGQTGKTFYDANGVKDDRYDLFAAFTWLPSDNLKVEANIQTFWQNTPETLGVNLMNNNLASYAQNQDLIDHGIYQSNSGPVKLSRDAIVFSKGDSSDAHISRGQTVITRTVSPDLQIINRSFVERVDRDRSHQFGYHENVVQTTAENRTEMHYDFDFAGRENQVVAGLSLRWEQSDVYADYDYPYELGTYDITNPARVFPLPTSHGYGEASTVTTFNPAVFWQEDIKVTDTLSALVGLRGDFYHARGRELFYGGTVDHADVTALSQAYSLVWKPIKNWSFYYTHNRMATQNTNGSAVGGGYYFFDAAYNPIGFQNDDFRHPSVLNEIGAKAQLLDNKLFVAADAFRQERARVDFGASSDIVVQGVELESVYQPTQGVEVFANATFQKGRYSNADVYQAADMSSPSFGATSPGNWDLVGFSDVLLNGGFRYTLPCGFGFGLSADWQSEQNVNIATATLPQLTIPSQVTYNGTFYYNAGSWSVSVDILNLSDEHNWIHNGDAYTGGALISQALPRRVEATVRYRF